MNHNDTDSYTPTLAERAGEAATALLVVAAMFVGMWAAPLVDAAIIAGR